MASQRWLRVGIAVGALLLVGAIWLGRGPVARADVAPDPFNGTTGRDAGPATITAVQMLSETVWIEIPPVPDPENWYRNTPLSAEVTADFLLHNPTDAAEALPVGFPSYLTNDASVAEEPEVRGLRVYENGIELATQSTRISGQLWDTWEMNFPPGDTQIRVTYYFYITSNPTWPFSDIKYILHTGAGWAGSIGQADLIVRFPYLAEENFIDGRSRPGNYGLSGYDVSWHFENLEPTNVDDIVLRVVNVQYWYSVLAARQSVAAAPTAHNYAVLARSYADIVWSCDTTPGVTNPVSICSSLLAQVAEAQYRKAMELDPANWDVRNEYIEFVSEFSGTLLPGEVDDYLSNLASLPTTTPAPSRTPRSTATRAAAPATATAKADQASATPLPLATATTLPTATPPSTQVAALPTAPLFTPAPVPSADGSNRTLNTVLVVAFVVLIAVGLVIALRRR